MATYRKASESKGSRRPGGGKSPHGSNQEQANEDQKLFQITELEKSGAIKEKWQGVNTHRETFVPRFNQQVDMNGQRIKCGKRAEATAEYFAAKEIYTSIEY